MRCNCAVLLLVCIVKIDAGNEWIKDLTSKKGLDLGYGLGIKLNESKKGKNVPIMERLSVDLNFGDVAGLSLGNPTSDGVELDFYLTKDVDYKDEGRSKEGGGKGGHHMLKKIIGFKVALMGIIMFAILKVLSIKAIFLAKAALIISLFVLLLKVKDKHQGPMEIIEVEQHPSHDHGGYTSLSAYEQLGYGGGGYYDQYGYGREAQSSNNYPDIVYATSGTATETVTNGGYATIVPNGSVQTVGNARNDQDSERRKNKSFYRKRKGIAAKGNRLSIKKYSSSAER